jgi:ankyrin repeat protein
LAAGTDVKDKHEMTPLYFAALGRKGHTKIVEILIAEGTDVNAKDFEGKTPLKRAAVVPF